MRLQGWVDLIATWCALAMMVLEVRAIRAGRKSKSAWPVVWFAAAATFTLIWIATHRSE